MKRVYLIGACAALFVACSNPPEDIRQDLRSVAKSSEVAENIALLSGILEGGVSQENPKFKSSNATMRWQAAQNLGDIGAIEAFEILRDRSLSELADSNPHVRRECVIALGKLRYSGVQDQKRKDIIKMIVRQLVGEDAPGRIPSYLESDRLVRRALLETLITLGLPPSDSSATREEMVMGYRDVAGELHNVAVQLYAAQNRIRNSVLHKAMLERAYGGLALVTATPLAQAKAVQAASDNIQDYHSWWVDQISKMPRLDE